MKISVAEALEKLADAKHVFTEVFSHGTLVVEVYQPKEQDFQQPHSRDEVYIIISGAATYLLEGHRTPCATGDFLFARAGAEHRFEDFSTDFATWVLFYGPEGGEKR